MNRLVVEGLRYHNVGPIDLAIDASECVTLSGPSGAGKTLMLRAIADLEPHSGDISLDGVKSETVSPPEWRKTVGMLPAESQWWRDTVGEHFSETRVGFLEALGFERSVLDWKVSRLSSGERQRLALLRLLANHPKALLLDEPTANLDPSNVERVETFIQDYLEENGCPALWVSHDPQQIRRVSSRHCVLLDGTLTEGMPP